MRHIYNVKFPFSFTLGPDESIELEGQLAVNVEYWPGHPGSAYLSDGEPGDPPEPAECYADWMSTDLLINGVDGKLSRAQCPALYSNLTAAQQKTITTMVEQAAHDMHERRFTQED